MDYANFDGSLGRAMTEAYARDLAESAKDKTDKLADRVAVLEAKIEQLHDMILKMGQ